MSVRKASGSASISQWSCIDGFLEITLNGYFPLEPSRLTALEVQPDERLANTTSPKKKVIRVSVVREMQRLLCINENYGACS